MLKNSEKMETYEEMDVQILGNDWLRANKGEKALVVDLLYFSKGRMRNDYK